MIKKPSFLNQFWILPLCIFLSNTTAQATTPLGLALWLMPGCKPGFAGANCQPVEGWGAHRKLSDAKIDRIADVCALSKRPFINWTTDQAQFSITPECREALLEVVPIDQSFRQGGDSQLALDNFLNSLLITLLVPVVASNEDQIASLLSEEEIGCDIYEMDVLQRKAPSSLPENFTLKNGNYPINRELFRYIIERTEKFSYDGSRLDVVAWESEGTITLTKHFGRLVTLPPVSTLVHEARHLDFGTDDGAPHVTCSAIEMENARSCDADITGANGLEIQFIDGILRASQQYRILLDNGNYRRLLTPENQRLLLLEMCATVKYKFNHAPKRLKAKFDSTGSCLVDIWQNPENAEQLLEEFYGPKIVI